MENPFEKPAQKEKRFERKVTCRISDNSKKFHCVEFSAIVTGKPYEVAYDELVEGFKQCLPKILKSLN